MVYNEDEIELINSVRLEGSDAWKNPLMNEIKSKIKKFYRTDGIEQCCYCRRDFQDEFNMVIDLEHILPKGNPLFTQYMFDIDNLNISCKRCNMRIKGEKTNFIVDIDSIVPDYKHSNKYHFIHPNFDVYKQNLKFISYREDDDKITKYIPLTEKGKFSYNFFQLKRIEIDSFDDAQDIDDLDNVLSENIPEQIRNEINELIVKL